MTQVRPRSLQQVPMLGAGVPDPSRRRDGPSPRSPHQVISSTSWSGWPTRSTGHQEPSHGLLHPLPFTLKPVLQLRQLCLDPGAPAGFFFHFTDCSVGTFLSFVQPALVEGQDRPTCEITGPDEQHIPLVENHS